MSQAVDAAFEAELLVGAITARIPTAFTTTKFVLFYYEILKWSEIPRNLYPSTKMMNKIFLGFHSPLKLAMIM